LYIAPAALGQCLSRLTRYSSAEIRYGKNIRGSSDLLAASLHQRKGECWNVSEWITELSERLGLIRDLTVLQEEHIAGRSKDYDKGKTLRCFKECQLVMKRILGMYGKIEKS